jgi:maleylpyruvate isomerase
VSEDDALDLDRIAAGVEGCIVSQERLREHLSALVDADPRAPSLLPDWTVGHVLTHIARNADGALRMLDGLAQYWGGGASRNADIALGAGRSWDELLADVEQTSAAVARRLRTVTDWTGTIRSVAGERPKQSLPAIRRREVEIHRIDLGLGYAFADLPSDFVRSELRTLTSLWQSRQPMGLTSLPEPVLRAAEHDRLAWLLGRLELPGVNPAGIY